MYLWPLEKYLMESRPRFKCKNSVSKQATLPWWYLPYSYCDKPILKCSKQNTISFFILSESENIWSFYPIVAHGCWSPKTFLYNFGCSRQQSCSIRFQILWYIDGIHTDIRCLVRHWIKKSHEWLWRIRMNHQSRREESLASRRYISYSEKVFGSEFKATRKGRVFIFMKAVSFNVTSNARIWARVLVFPSFIETWKVCKRFVLSTR